MTTAVVVTTIVTDQASEATFLEQLAEQIRKNDKDLCNKLNHLDLQAQVESAVFNIADFLHYADTWLREADDTGEVAGFPVQASAPSAPLNELDLMDQALDQLRQGRQAVLAPLSAEEQMVIEAEAIGEDFSARPFLY